MALTINPVQDGGAHLETSCYIRNDLKVLKKWQSTQTIKGQWTWKQERGLEGSDAQHHLWEWCRCSLRTQRQHPTWDTETTRITEQDSEAKRRGDKLAVTSSQGLWKPCLILPSSTPWALVVFSVYWARSGWQQGWSQGGHGATHL